MAEDDKLLVIAITDFDPKESDGVEGEETTQTAPDVSAQLSFQCCDRFEVIDKEVTWWLFVKCLKTQHQGYIPSIMTAPLRPNLTQQEEWDLEHGAELSPHLVNPDVNLKFFPGAPRERDVLNRDPNPEDSANFFSIISFWWMNSLITKGYKRPLKDEDLCALSKKKKASYMVPRIGKKYSEEQRKFYLKQSKKKKAKSENEESLKLRENDIEDEDVSFKPKSKKKKKPKKKNPSLVKVLAKEFSSTLLLGVLYKFFNDALSFCQPQLLALIIQFTENKSIPAWRGYLIALAMLGVAFVQSIFLHQYFHIAFTTGMRLRTCVLGLVYKKALVLTSGSKKESTAGEMVNLMSVDAQRLMDLMSYVNQVWSSPLVILVALGFLYNTMGVSILAGFGVMLLLIPMNLCVTRVMKKFQSKLMLEKDKRIKIMNEILSGIKILKLYAWEESFMKKVFGIRDVELRHLRNTACLNAGFVFTFTCSPFMVSLATFMVYIYTGNELTASKAFVALSLFNLLSFPVAMLPFIISSIIQAQVSIERLTNFLNLEELDPENIKREMPEHLNTQSIHIEEATFGWEKGEKPVLTNINLNIPTGSLVAVVGQVGCGKSTLLSSLLGETEKFTGEVYVKGTVAYVAQQAWIQNATLRDNILFGRMFMSKRYCKAVNACALRTDLDILPGGDQTEIGERGINLSGGQKQRVSLARAVYFDADVYLLDDPLSAVDSHVGKHIFDKVIGPRGLLKKKTRILVTHGLNFLPQVDQIIVLQDGKVSEVGTYRELLNNEGAFAEFIRTYAAEQEDGHKPEELPLHEEHYMSQENIDIIAEYQDPVQLRARSNSVLSINTFTSTGRTECGYTANDNDVDKMIGEERSETGRVKLTVFLTYARSIGLFISFFFVLFLMAGEASLIGSRVWLARWSTTNVTTSSERDMYIGVYGGLGLSQALFILFSSLTMAVGSMIASRNLHTHLLENVMHSSMSFFETTPLGRIVNRFSKDMDVIDDIIPKSITMFLRTFFTVFGTMVVISYATPIFLSAIVPLVFVYAIVQRYYVATSRQLKRIESVSRSPIYNHFFETINGSSTIRAYWLQQHFIRENYYKIDENQVAYYPSVSANRWLALRLEFVGTCIIFFAALFSVASRENTNSGLVGLAITYALQVTSSLNWMVRQTSELETNIVSVERVKEYSEIPTEAEWIYPDSRPPENWPMEGRVHLDGFDLKYRDGLPLVLKNIDCAFEPGEKIGIVGRTGAGKSTLTLALFRILEAAGGKIIIDDVDISKIGLHDLRSRLTIIPQDPVLFSGTLRLNLDPFDKYTDEDLWGVLEISHLKSFVSTLEEGLLHPISEGGENLSVGQRQLVCLARALLRKSKILVLDEATAAVDLETDELIQKTIRREFADRTVLTIAHRLNTIIDYSRILVLDKGFIVEFDTPSNLLAKQGVFYSMAKDAGLV